MAALTWNSNFSVFQFYFQHDLLALVRVAFFAQLITNFSIMLNSVCRHVCSARKFLCKLSTCSATLISELIHKIKCTCISNNTYM